MPTPKQIAANTQNSKHSTGPKTAEGKLVVSQNATRHGLLSKRLIIPGLEQEREWKAHCQRIMESLSPVGGLEGTLAGRIAANLWRLNRIIRHEAESLRMDQEKAIETVAAKRKFQQNFGDELPDWAYHPEKASEMLESAREDKRLITKLLNSKDAESFSNDEASWLIQTGFEYVKNEIQIPDEQWPPKQQGFKRWDRGMVCRVLVWMAGKDGQKPDSFLNAMMEGIDSLLEKAEKYAAEASRDLNFYRRKHLLPNTDELDLICRYESHLQRAYQRDLEALQRLQAARKGNHPPLSPVIDVDVASVETK